MSADIFSNFIGMTLQGIGNNNNAWGTILNGSALVPLERAIVGNVIHNVTGGTLDLSANPPPAGLTAALDHIQILQGTLTSALVIIVPTNSKTWVFYNQTTGAFPVSVRAAGAGGTSQIPTGTAKHVFSDGSNNIVRLDRDSVGEFVHAATVNPGTLLCNGASVLKTDYADLYSKIGTAFGSVDSLHFNLPNTYDTGRFLRSVSSVLGVATYQSNQNQAHTHGGVSFSGTTSTESNDHTHAGSGSTGTESAGHTHGGVLTSTNTYNSPGGATNIVQSANGGSTSGESNSHTHAYSFTTGGISTTHTHTYSGTTGTIPSSGGAEARPEALAVIISIRY